MATIMATATTIPQAETPARNEHHHHHHHLRHVPTAQSDDSATASGAAHVTPLDSSISNCKNSENLREEDEESASVERVSFASAPCGDTNEKSDQQRRQLEIGRGDENNADVIGTEEGRFESPPRQSRRTSSASNSPKKETILLEFKAYRSPNRKRNEDAEVPSLCSTHSDQGMLPDQNKNNTVSGFTGASIAAVTEELLSLPESQQRQPYSPSRNLTPPRMDQDKTKRSPMMMTLFKSPVPGQEYHHFQNLPSLEENHFMSPGGFFLSPNPPTPSFRLPQHPRFNRDGEETSRSEEEKKGDGGDRETLTNNENKDCSNEKAGAESDLKQSPRASPKPTLRDRDYFVVATPTTDFAIDYGKGSLSNYGFDSSNVLAWLQSPTPGLFSPGGGLGSMSIMNTPRVPGTTLQPRTPRTPTISTSFFFSDVAGLPRPGEAVLANKNSQSSPEKNANTEAASSADANDDAAPSKPIGAQGISNIICISPLASSRHRCAEGKDSATNTPSNLKDIFSSPRERASVRGLPLLHDTPSKNLLLHSGRPGGLMPRSSGSGVTNEDPSIDSVHLGLEVEDEDLSVLLNLHSTSNTPRPIAPASVFRSPLQSDKTGETGKFSSGLQLPMIGNTNTDGKASKLLLKSSSRSRDSEDFAAHQMGVRTEPENKSSQNDPSKSSSLTQQQQEAYSRPPYRSHPGQPHPGADSGTGGYYTIPPGSLPPGIPPGAGGSMRVVVGAPPPPPRQPGSPRGTPPSSQPPPPYGNYPPGTYQHPPHPYGHQYQYAGYSFGSHYPPPPQSQRQPSAPVPQYNKTVQQTPSAPPAKEASTSSKKGKNSPTKTSGAKTPKSGSKRPAPTPSSDENGKTAHASTKKVKKSPSSSSSPSKKKKSPQTAEQSERRTAAEAIQAINAVGGDKAAAALAAAILRGVTMRPSGKWQAQLYFAGKSRYIGVFDTREKAALAYEIAREKLKSGPQEPGANSAKSTENLVNDARKAAFEGVNGANK